MKQAELKSKIDTNLINENKTIEMEMLYRECNKKINELLKEKDEKVCKILEREIDLIEKNIRKSLRDLFDNKD